MNHLSDMHELSRADSNQVRDHALCSTDTKLVRLPRKLYQSLVAQHAYLPAQYCCLMGHPPFVASMSKFLGGPRVELGMLNVNDWEQYTAESVTTRKVYNDHQN